MKKVKKYSHIISLVAVFILFLAISAIRPSKQAAAESALTAPETQANFTVFATGLNNPRGLEFGPDGNLYVAEGGTGGSNSTVGNCTQVDPPVGPYLGSNTGGRISKIDQNGNRSTVIDTLPSSQTGPGAGSQVSGVADVAFIGDTLYALLGGAGCSHGVSSLNNGIFRINANGTATLIADLSAFQQANPVANPSGEDFEPDGTWYSMVVVRGAFYAVEPNHGEVDKITPDGVITRLVDVSADLGHIVPTAITYKGNFFLGNLGTFPIVPGTEQVRKLNPSGNHKTWVTGLTTVLGLAFDGRDRLYVLESLTNPGFPGPGQLNSGRVVRIDPSGVKTVIASGLTAPTAMTFGPDGALYVSNFGFGAPPGAGQVVRIEVPLKGGNSAIHTNVTSSASISDVQVTPMTNPQPSRVFLPQIVQQTKEQSVTAETVQHAASEKLAEDSELSSVIVVVSEGQAVLVGTVNSVAAKQRAQRLVGAVRGVKSIENKIEVQ